jgi:hypothetical protein
VDVVERGNLYTDIVKVVNEISVEFVPFVATLVTLSTGRVL